MRDQQPSEFAETLTAHSQQRLVRHRVAWFSTGVSSAVAVKLIADELNQILYTHIDDQHPDSLRFVKDCEQWFGKPVVILQSHLKSVESAIRKNGKYIAGPGGAACTRVNPRFWMSVDYSATSNRCRCLTQTSETRPHETHDFN